MYFTAFVPQRLPTCLGRSRLSLHVLVPDLHRIISFVPPHKPVAIRQIKTRIRRYTLIDVGRNAHRNRAMERGGGAISPLPVHPVLEVTTLARRDTRQAAVGTPWVSGLFLGPLPPPPPFCPAGTTVTRGHGGGTSRRRVSQMPYGRHGMSGDLGVI